MELARTKIRGNNKKMIRDKKEISLNDTYFIKIFFYCILYDKILFYKIKLSYYDPLIQIIKKKTKRVV